MPRILLELFDSDSMDNIISLQVRRYDCAVFFCPASAVPGERARKLLREIVAEKMGTVVEFLAVPDDSVESAVEGFRAAIKDMQTKLGADTVFEIDLTGGNELLIAAAGALFTGGKVSGNISAHRVNIVTGKVKRVFGKLEEAPEPKQKLDFSDIVTLTSGKVISISGDEVYDFTDKTFRTEVLKLWNGMRKYSSEWNRFCSFTYPEGVEPDENGYVYRRVAKSGDSEVAHRIMRALKKSGIVTEYSIEEDSLKYKLAASCVTHPLYVTGGTVLEMYTAVAAATSGSFTDVAIQVVLDFDGVITHRPADPCNELDVTFMWGLTPVFVSCKNTEPTKEYLYEIETMRTHFGGKSAAAMLVTTLDALDPVRQRAREMGIVLIDGVNELTLKEFRAKLVNKLSEMKGC